MPKYFCERLGRHQDAKVMKFEKVIVTQPVPGNPNVNMITYWRCPECGNKFIVILSWNAETEKFHD